jgi:hypothetical protein
MVKVADPVFVSVTTCALVVPMFTLPKFKLEGDRSAEAASPVPVRPAVCGLPEELSLTTSVPDRIPAALGVKVTLTVQLDPAATPEPQLFVCAKSPLLVPVIETLEMLTVVLPGLDSVTLCAELVVPTAWPVKVKLDGESVIAGITPVPVKLAV